MHLLSISPHSNYTDAVVSVPQNTLERWRKDVRRCSVMQLLHLNFAALQDVLVLQQCAIFLLFKSPLL